MTLREKKKEKMARYVRHFFKVRGGNEREVKGLEGEASEQTTYECTLPNQGYQMSRPLSYKLSH